jgi:hypothetical protein
MNAGELRSERVWHGTGRFGAHNIYEDKKDGFHVQWASDGHWGRGLYFAQDPGEKNVNSFAPFIYTNDHFAKTGSGRTQGNSEKRVAFFLRVLALVCHDWREGVAPVRGFRRLGM